MAMSSSSPPNPPSSAAPRLFSNPPPPSGYKTPIYPHFPATATTTATATATAAFHSRHPDCATVAPRLQHVLVSLNRQPPSDRGILYPKATFGRGFLPKPTTASDQPVVMTNPGGFPPRPYAPNPGRVPYGSQPAHLIRPTHLPHSLLSSTGGVVKDFPISTHPKTAASPSSVSDCNGYKDIRERRRDDSFATVRDRKVRVSDGASLYAQCRSWLRNGFPEESQEQCQ